MLLFLTGLSTLSSCLPSDSRFSRHSPFFLSSSRVFLLFSVYGGNFPLKKLCVLLAAPSSTATPIPPCPATHVCLERTRFHASRALPPASLRILSSRSGLFPFATVVTIDTITPSSFFRLSVVPLVPFSPAAFRSQSPFSFLSCLNPISPFSLRVLY